MLSLLKMEAHCLKGLLVVRAGVADDGLGCACVLPDGNHFHLVVETPQPNLVAEMRWILGDGTLLTPALLLVWRGAGRSIGGDAVWFRGRTRRGLTAGNWSLGIFSAVGTSRLWWQADPNAKASPVEER